MPGIVCEVFEILCIEIMCALIHSVFKNVDKKNKVFFPIGKNYF